MAVYIALLRGVNVGGNLLRMDRLRALCADLGLKNARTYLQSGNIVFAAQGTPAHWADTLERKLAGQSRLPVSVIVRTSPEMRRVIAENPFLGEKGIDVSRLYVTFLQQQPAKAVLDRLHAIPARGDRLRHAGTEIYLHCPGGYGKSKLSNNAIEKALSLRATTRNWNTVIKLHHLSASFTRH
jgi:uncharacterized protein (DUF1697 family)